MELGYLSNVEDTDCDLATGSDTGTSEKAA